jgi:outer membrane lipopolysaccharide assembly protein LptE/RlpB
MRKRLLAAALLAAALLTASCGYHFPGQGRTLPGGATSVYVAEFVNRTREPGLDTRVRSSLEDEITRRGVFELVPSRDGAAVSLEGSVDRLDVRPVAFSNSDQALQYETIATVSAQLRDTRNDAIVWSVSGLRANDSYGAVFGTVVAESSQFQEQSPIDAQQLGQLTDVQLTESQRAEALVRLLENLSRDLYNAMVEDF